MITTKLKLKVIDEATKLKSCATQEELEKLNFKRLDPERIQKCICFARRFVFA